VTAPNHEIQKSAKEMAHSILHPPQDPMDNLEEETYDEITIYIHEKVEPFI
jgi:hypothetical protein